VSRSERLQLHHRVVTADDLIAILRFERIGLTIVWLFRGGRIT
jgi:hypothetical protein